MIDYDTYNNIVSNNRVLDNRENYQKFEIENEKVLSFRNY